LTSSFEPNDLASRRIAASLLASYPEVIVLTPASAGWSFAFAGTHLPFDRTALQSAVQSASETQFIIFDTPAVRAIVGDAQPITLDSMDIVFQTSASWIRDRLGGR